MELFKNEYFSLFTENSKVYITVYSIGFNINEFSNLLKNYPFINIKHFFDLKSALENGASQKLEIGALKQKIEVSVASDEMSALVRLNITEEELNVNRKSIIENIIYELKANNVVYGIIHDALLKNLTVQNDILIAKGILPIQGDDAIINYIKLPPRKPTIREDGTTDFYEMNLIYEVEKDFKLGEKIRPTPGVSGKTVRGNLLMAKAGNDKAFNYDKKSIGEFNEGDKIVLRSLIHGAVSFNSGKISVLNHLIINGDVGYETGNINFNGYVTVKGTVLDDFSVIASDDISIESNLGIGAVSKIISTNGDIYIKGGISGKGKAYIDAGRHVFVKYSNSCEIKSGESINIGFYSLDSILTSKNIIVNNDKSKIIGGQINAKAKVIATTIGNKFEKKTIINVEGFDRQQIKKDLDEILVQYKKCLLEVDKNKREMKIYENAVEDINELRSIEEYKYYNTYHEQLMLEISKLEEKRKSLMDYLESKGEGEVSILKGAYPQTFLEIKNFQKVIQNLTNGTFYTQDNQLHTE